MLKIYNESLHNLTYFETSLLLNRLQVFIQKSKFNNFKGDYSIAEKNALCLLNIFVCFNS